MNAVAVIQMAVIAVLQALAIVDRLYTHLCWAKAFQTRGVITLSSISSHSV